MKTKLKIDPSLTDGDTLWRYMDIAKLVAILQGKLWLARADSFRDRHEGLFPDEMRDFLREAYKSLPESPGGEVKNAEDFQDYLIKNTFISCWHRNTNENMVMWEIYGRDASAVAVKTSVGRISKNFSGKMQNGFSFDLKPILYKNANEVAGNLKYEDCFFRKRRHYAFEQEVRLSLNTYSRLSPTKKTSHGINIPINSNDLIEDIIVHPDCPPWYFDVVTEIAKKFDAIAKVSRGIAGNG